MIKTNSETRILFLFTTVILLFLLAIDIVFFKEKMYGDSGYYLFNVINFKKFSIEHLRPASIFVEAIPLCLTKANIDIKSILLAFSLNIWGYYFLCILYCILVLKNLRVGLAVLFVILLGVKVNYFNPVSELILSAPLMLIGYVYYSRDDIKFKDAFAALLLFSFTVYNHPLYTIILPIMLGLNYFVTRRMEKNRIIFICLLIGVIILHYFQLDDYEKNPLAEVGNSDDSGIGYLLKFNYARFFWKTLVAYAGCIILTVLTVLKIKKTRSNILPFVFIFISIMGYIFLVLYKYGRFFSENNEPFERYFFPVPLIIVTIYFFYGYKNSLVHNLLLFVIVVYHSFLLASYSTFVHKRFSLLDMASKYAQSLDMGKISFRKENYYPVEIGHDWIMCLESVLNTSLDGSQNCRQFFVEEFYQKEDLNKVTSEQFIRFPYPLWAEDIKNLNYNYFQLKPSPISHANTDSIQSSMPDHFFNSISIEYNGELEISKAEEILVPIIITNKNNIPLTSGLKQELVYISYHWNNEKGSVVWDGLRTPLLGDVHKNLEQFIKLKTPDAKGLYTLELALVYEGKKWAPITPNQRSSIKVD